MLASLLFPLDGWDGFCEMVATLISLGAVLDAATLDKQTPLHFSARCGHLEIIEKLIACRGAVCQEDAQGRTPLHYAACAGHTEAVSRLSDR